MDRPHCSKTCAPHKKTPRTLKSLNPAVISPSFPQSLKNIENLEFTIISLKKDNSGLQSKLESLESEKNDLMAQLREYAEEVEELRREKICLIEEKSGLREENERLGKENFFFTNNFVNKTAEIEKLKVEYAESKRMEEEMKGKVEELNALVLELCFEKEKIKKIISPFVRISSDFSMVEDNLNHDEINKNLQEENQEAPGLDETIRIIIEEKQHLKNNYEKEMKRNEVLQKTVEQMEKEIEEKSKLLSKIELQLDEANHFKKEYEIEKNRSSKLESEVKCLIEELSTIKDELHAKEDKIKDVSNSREEYAKNISDINNKSLIQFKNYLENLNNLKREIEKNKLELQIASSEKHAFDIRFAEAGQKEEMLTNEIERLKEKNKKLMEAFEELKMKYSQILLKEEDKENLIITNEDLTNKIEKFKLNEEKWRIKIIDCEDTIAKLNTKIFELESSVRKNAEILNDFKADVMKNEEFLNFASNKNNIDIEEILNWVAKSSHEFSESSQRYYEISEFLKKKLGESETEREELKRKLEISQKKIKEMSLKLEISNGDNLQLLDKLDKVNLAESSQKNERVYLVKEKEELSKKLSTSENDINLLKSQLKAKELEFMQIESEQEKKSVRFQTIIKIINDFLKYFELETFNKEETLEYVDFLERNLKAIQNSFSIKIEDVKNLNNTVNIMEKRLEISKVKSNPSIMSETLKQENIPINPSALVERKNRYQIFQNILDENHFY